MLRAEPSPTTDDVAPAGRESSDSGLPKAALGPQRYPKTLQPDHDQSIELDGITYTVPGTTLALHKWTGPRINDDFNGKGLIDFEGAPLFAELVVQRMAEASGWSAVWVEPFAAPPMNPYIMIDWNGDASISKQNVVTIDVPYVAKTLARIAELNGNSYSGCWDVVAWRQPRIIFVELKRTKHDDIQATQVRWLKAGLKAGLTVSDFLIAKWDYS